MTPDLITITGLILAVILAMVSVYMVFRHMPKCPVCGRQEITRNPPGHIRNHELICLDCGHTFNAPEHEN